ncbi:MAG TPA: DUF5672 family protein, partial [Candidatus Eisenbacteria bacterium]|nr:DUF5672 family protein [Candidatus Eisenbacteria bacterium]
LRKVSSAIRVLRRRRASLRRVPSWLGEFALGAGAMALYPLKVLKRRLFFTKRQLALYHIDHEAWMHSRSRPWFEDVFWSMEAPRVDPAFRIPRVEEALAFSFELGAATCYRRAGQKLPFGCHYWTLPSERPFWKSLAPVLGYAVPDERPFADAGVPPWGRVRSVLRRPRGA